MFMAFSLDSNPWSYYYQCSVIPGNPYWGGRLSTADLLVLTSLDQLLSIMKTLFSFFPKQATLMKWSTVRSLPLQSVFPGYTTMLQGLWFCEYPPGTTISNGREPKSCLGQVFNSKLGRIATLPSKCMACMQPLLELKPRARVCPVH
jgi:hypothetical protein